MNHTLKKYGYRNGTVQIPWHDRGACKTAIIGLPRLVCPPCIFSYYGVCCCCKMHSNHGSRINCFFTFLVSHANWPSNIFSRYERKFHILCWQLCDWVILRFALHLQISIERIFFCDLVTFLFGISCSGKDEGIEQHRGLRIQHRLLFLPQHIDLIFFRRTSTLRNGWT